jgi:hypothetical protein
MAVVRHGPTNGCVHGPGCPHDIGPTQDIAVYVVDTTIERRPATPAELARLSPAIAPPAQRPRTPGPSGSWRNYRSALGTPLPVTPLEEHPVTTPAAPPAIPCGSCLHERVCGQKDLIHPEYRRELTAGLTLVYASVTVECADLLPKIALRETTADRMAIVPREEAMIAAGKRQARHPGKPGEVEEKAKRAADCLAALERHGGDRKAAAAELGIRGNAFAMIVKYAQPAVVS